MRWSVLALVPASGAVSAPAATAAAFPVTITAANGKVTVPKRPARIVSLSPTATESLFAIGAGTQVIAVDDQSDYPKSAPKTTLSGFTPNVEAIAGLPARPRRRRVRPEGPRRRADEARDPGDPPQAGARRFPGAYQQIRQLGHVTGHEPQATRLDREDEGADRADRREARRTAAGVRASTTSSTRLLLGDVEDVRRPGLRAVRPAEHRGRRHAAAPDYPQLSPEYIVSSNPDLVVLADSVCCGQKPSTRSPRGPAGRASRRCATGRSCGSTTRSRPAGGRGS